MSTRRWLALVGVILLGSVAAGAPDDRNEVPAVKKLTGIALAGTNERGSPTEPTIIADADALARAFPDAKAQARIKEQVDFAKQQVVYFRWAGSGQDRITSREVKDGAKVMVIFDYTPGLTRDLRQHQELFAVRKGIPHKIERKKFGH
jgi:hypothetical protein